MLECGACGMKLSTAPTRGIHNFKNIAKSSAYHHQRQMCYVMADS